MAKKSDVLKTEEAKIKDLKKQQREEEKKLKSTVTAKAKADSELKKTNLEVDKMVKKLEKLKKTDALKYDSELFNCWGIECLACITTGLSGSKSKDIDLITSIPDKSVREWRSKLVVKYAQIVCNKRTPSEQEIALAAEKLQKYNDESKEYAVGFTSIWRDFQNTDKEGRPLPIIPQHMILACLKNSAKFGFNLEYCISRKDSPVEGAPAFHFLREAFKIKPYHIFLYKDQQLKQLITEADIVIDGQQPVGDVKGFQKSEVIRGPIYFKFQLYLNPKSRFPMVSDKKLVLDTLELSTLFGLGGRRAINFGNYEILDIKSVKVGPKFSKKFEKVIKAA